METRDRSIRGLRWLTVVLAVASAGWMAFDGSRALIVGDYVTPSKGQHAGELGPWTKIVETVGIEPRSTLMKSIFAGYGLVWLFVVGAYVRGAPWAAKAMLLAAVGSSWNLFIGTVSSLIQVLLLIWADLRPASIKEKTAAED